MKNLLYLLLCVVCCSLGCHTNVDEFIPYPTVVNPGERFDGDFFDRVTPPAARYAVDLDETSIVETADGTQLELAAGALVDAAGVPATGAAELLLDYAPRLGDLIRYRRVSTDAQGALLRTSGQLAVRFQRDGTPLSLADGATLRVRYAAEGATNADETLFRGVTATRPDAVRIAGWAALPNTDVLADEWDTQNGLISGYRFAAPGAGWWQLGAYVDPALPRTTICAGFEPSYDAANTVVFAVFPELPAVVELYDADTNGEFCLDGIPVGTAVDYLSITEKADDTYELARFTSTVQAEQRVDLVPTPRSLMAIEAVLNSY